MEAFSDGVFAVAITLLVLYIAVPDPRTPHLGHTLGRQWPIYAAYVTSFMTIGIIWINHHAMISRLRIADHVILMLNLLLLLWVAVLPFATSLLAAFLRDVRGQHLAAGVYAGSFLAMALAFAALNRHILLSKHHMLTVELSVDRRREILRRSSDSSAVSRCTLRNRMCQLSVPNAIAMHSSTPP